MSKQISTTPPSNEVTVNTLSGMATITRAGLARRLNVHRNTLKNYLYGRGKTQGNQPLDEDSVLDTVAYFAHNSQTPTQEAKDLLVQISKAGTKAWLYHEAGYVVSASPVKHVALPEDYVSALRALADKEEQRILLLEENTEKHIETDSSDTHFTVRRVRGLNQGMKLDGKLLVKRSEELEVLIKQVFDLYEQQVNSYHRDIWLDVYPDVILP